MTCYASFKNFPHELTWSDRKRKSAENINLVLHRPEDEPAIKKTRQVRDALKILGQIPEDTQKYVWKHMEHLVSEHFDRDRTRRDHRKQIDHEYRKHLLAIRDAMVAKKQMAKVTYNYSAYYA